MAAARCLPVMAGRVPAIPPTATAQMAGTRPAMTVGIRPCAARPLEPARPHFHGVHASGRLSDCGQSIQHLDDISVSWHMSRETGISTPPAYNDGTPPVATTTAVA